MMQKTLKKSKKDNAEKIKSYIVTENGLGKFLKVYSYNFAKSTKYLQKYEDLKTIHSISVENDDNINLQKRRDSKTTLLSVLGVEDAKKKLKNLAERRRSSTLTGENTEDSSKKEGETNLLKNLRATLADLKAVEDGKRNSEQGLQELEKKKKRNIKIGTTLMTSKAIAIMSTSRKQRMKASVDVSLSKNIINAERTVFCLQTNRCRDDRVNQSSGYEESKVK